MCKDQEGERSVWDIGPFIWTLMVRNTRILLLLPFMISYHTNIFADGKLTIVYVFLDLIFIVHHSPSNERPNSAPEDQSETSPSPYP